jgi:hypothetical protein
VRKFRKDLAEFESAIALLGWANDDFHRLERSVRRYFAGETCEMFGELDPDTGYMAFKYRMTKRPPETWRRLTFRFICDVRHCVDQAMFAATAVVEGAAPDRDVYFPWAENPTDLTHRRKKIPPELWPILDRLQPYRGGDDYPGGDDTVYALRKLAGPNKHRVAVNPSALPTNYKVSGTGVNRIILPRDGWDASKNELTIMLVERRGKPDYKVEVSVDISFGEVEGLEGQPVLSALDHFGKYATFVINNLAKASYKIAGRV